MSLSVLRYTSPDSLNCLRPESKPIILFGGPYSPGLLPLAMIGVRFSGPPLSVRTPPISEVYLSPECDLHAQATF